MNNEQKNMSVRKLLPFLLLPALVISGYIFRSDIAYFLADYLVINNRLGQAGAIAVLGGASPERILEAVDIYNEGYAGIMIITRGRKPQGMDILESKGIGFIEEYENNYSVALEMGINRQKISILETRTENTVREIETLYSFLKKENIDSVIIVTSKYHSRRTSIIAGHVFGDSIGFIIRSSSYDGFDPEKVLEVPFYRTMMLFEYQKLIYYYMTKIW